MHTHAHTRNTHHRTPHRLYHVFYYIEIHKPMAAKGGYMVYTVIFYILTAMLFVCVAICT
jgi:hypothetical protein